MTPRSIIAMALLALVSAGCGADPTAQEDGSDEAREPLNRKDLRSVFKRVVLGRAYHHDHWMLPEVDRDGDGTPDFDRDSKYVCDTYVKLEPTYVSGLVRLDAAEPITTEQVQTFNDIRKCIRAAVSHPVRFDVVLNAAQYESGQALVARMKEIDGLMKPDIFFFDFYQNAYRKNPKVIRAGIDWAHAHGHAIGGNDWGTEAPKDTDFVAVCDNPSVHAMFQQIEKLHQNDPGLPVLAHLENNPGNDGNRGEKWLFDWTTDERKQLLAEEAAGQSTHGYRYMYPVFFPQSTERKGIFEQFDWYKGFVAYDARLDGNVLQKMKQLLDAHD